MADPRRPAESLAPAECQAWNLAGLHGQPHVPIELETQVQPDPVDQLSERSAAGQKAFVLLQGQRPQVNPELVLTVPHAAAQHRAGTQRNAVRRETRAVSYTH